MRKKSSGPVGTVPPDAAGARTPGPAVSGAAHGDWLTLGRDGRLSLYAPTEGGLLRWTETTVGGADWNGPHLVPGAGLTHLTVVQGDDSYVHFLGRRERVGADGARRVDVVHAIQYQTGLAFTDWRSLGNPHPDREQGLLLGPPVGAVAADGSVHVFARGAHGGLVLRREAPNGKWRAWENLQGVGLSPWPAPVALAGGRIEVCVDAETGVFVWRQLEAGGDFTGPRGFALRPAPGTVAALETGPEQATFFWTDADSGAAVSWRAGGWPTPLGGSPAQRPYATLRTTLDGYDCLVLAYRDADGHAVFGVGGVGDEGNGLWWYALTEPCEGSPALARDGRGRVVMALIDPEGRPRVARQEPGTGLSLGPWSEL
ncbi:hypothetical protein [Streptomyces prunicolor]|uniref:hypothetical protein n=1 Tax=Streptomyces prunicolor TaxID=67348 RepID=UPI00341D1821